MKSITLRLTATAVLTLLSLTFVQAKKPGPSDGGGTLIANPAFVYRDDVNGSLYLTTSDGNSALRLTQSGNSNDEGATWSPDFDTLTPGHQGWIAFFRAYDPRYIWGDLLAVPSDGSGPPVLIRSYTDLQTPPPDGIQKTLSCSPDGSRILYAGGGLGWAVEVSTGNVELVLPLVSNGDSIHSPTFSPDLEVATPGYQGAIAFQTWNDIYTCPVEIDSAGDLQVGVSVNVTQSSEFAEENPAWSPDGQFLAFFRSDVGADIGDNDHRLSVIDLNTSDTWGVVGVYSSQVRPTWSPDGELIGFSDSLEVRGKWTFDVFLVSPWTPSIPFNVTTSSRAIERDPQWSPSWWNDLP